MDCSTEKMPGTKKVGAAKIEQLARIWLSAEKARFRRVGNPCDAGIREIRSSCFSGKS
jgi:hypothetical protein